MAWEIKVYRGLSAIARFLGVSTRRVKKLMQEDDLICIREGGQYVLTNKEYDDQRKEQINLEKELRKALKRKRGGKRPPLPPQ